MGTTAIPDRPYRAAWQGTSQALAATFPRVSVACGTIVCATGLLALLGWILDHEPLRRVYAPSNIGLKANTAILLLLSGCSLLLLFPRRIGTVRRIAGRILGAVVVLVGLATLSQHVFGWDLGIDQLLFREPPGAPGTSSPNRMGPPASVCFPLLGGALLGLDRQRLGRPVLFPVLAIAVLVIALIPLLGYIFEANQLYGIARLSGIALHTAVAFILMAAGILCARPEVGVMRVLVAEDSGGVLLRRLLPAAVLLPVILGWLRVLGQEAGYYDVQFGRVLLILSFILVFAGLTWWTAAVISRHASARASAEASEGQLKDQLVAALQNERRARAAAEHSNRMKDEFLAMLSHELRTPLHSILGWAQVLARSDLPERARQGIEGIERNSKLQAQLIDDLLDMSRIVSGKVQLDVQEVDLPLVIEGALAAAEPVAASKGILIEHSLDPAVGTIRGDPARLQQVLWNLLSNAIKFTQRGGRVSMELTRGVSSAEIRIHDTGIGIAPDMLEQVFERFRQANASTTREHGGLGLGLSIARQLAELHGGSVHAESEGEGRGSTFTLRLPLPSASLPEAPPERGVGIPRGTPLSLEGIRVLAVDDQPDARTLIERILSDQNAEVVVATGVDQALRLLEGGPRFDVLVSDIGMPVRDGYDLIREIRSRDRNLPAIALTAFARADDRQKALAAGYDAYLAKPVHPDDLVASIARLAGRGVVTDVGPGETQ